MDQIRPFPPQDLLDKAEEDEAIRLAPAPDLMNWVITNFLTVGGPLHNPDHDHIAELLHDNEEFVGVIKRWGADESVKRLIEVAKQAPFVSDVNISKCCGTCLIS
ncbi:hypothetical protein [Acinetobacter sp. AS23]|uniref:hypothetical protein n=1 Tax=Acinetobacter sp. AS23 TaxID=2871688 RepID=UPI0020275BE5|nr:hypothetical protein [Acinetobacter sp. AS23]URM40040.1 hypothetical protein K6I41_13825 [Acinetobacter sp. AS23]